MPRSHKSAVERLQELPEVFTLNTVAAMLDCDTGNASTYIARWKDSGLVKSLGPRTGIHFNLLKNPQADQDKRMENDVWHPDPDDLEWDEIDAQRLQLAFRYFDIPTPEDWAEEIEHLSRSGQDDLFM